MREKGPFGEIPLGDFFCGCWRGQDVEAQRGGIPTEGRFLSLDFRIYRVQLRDRMNSLEEKSVIHYCELRGDLL